MTQEEQQRITQSGAYGSTMEALRRAEAGLPDLSTSYDGEIRSLYEKIVNRPAFRYDAESDPLYGMYRDRYVREGRMAMRDTVGQTAQLTGGYASSYAESVGQQQYGAYLQKLGEAMPELYGAALRRWQAEGDALNGQLSAAKSLASDEYGRKKDRYTLASDAEQRDYERRWASYQSLISVISQSGYEPKDEELTAAGMSRELADALRKEYLRANRLLRVPRSGPAEEPDWYGYGGGGGDSSGGGNKEEKLIDSRNPEKRRRL